jgi:hypothetical protein
MGPESILLSVRENGREGSYRFTCPECEDAVEKRADRKIVALLVSAGVDIDRDAEPGARHPELFDEDGHEGESAGPPAPAFSPDDVIEFHYLLEDDAYVRGFFANRG